MDWHVTRRLLAAVYAPVLALYAGSAFGEIELTLKNTFIEKYKNRTSIVADCTIDHTKGKANPAKNDGDMHMASRCPQEIALPLVAEIMNAKLQKPAIDLSKDLEDSQQVVRIEGAWRIWNEHAGDQVFVQGKSVVRAENTNPDHVFEIHPVAQFGSMDVRSSFIPIEGYVAKNAEDAFNRYENTRAKIVPGKTSTKIISAGLGYNYVQFQLHLNEKPFPVVDGSFAYARVRDMEGELIHRKKRMVFVKDTPPEIAVRGAKAGDCLRVLGIPRLDLALVSWRVKNAKTKPHVLDWTLPYEIIVVGVYPGECELD